METVIPFDSSVYILVLHVECAAPDQILVP